MAKPKLSEWDKIKFERWRTLHTQARLTDEEVEELLLLESDLVKAGVLWPDGKRAV